MMFRIPCLRKLWNLCEIFCTLEIILNFNRTEISMRKCSYSSRNQRYLFSKHHHWIRLNVHQTTRTFLIVLCIFKAGSRFNQLFIVFLWQFLFICKNCGLTLRFIIAPSSHCTRRWELFKFNKRKKEHFLDKLKQ